jgi:hypothetical protein
MPCLHSGLFFFAHFPQTILFSQRFDKPGIHEIKLTNQPDARFGKSQITLDRFELEVPDLNKPPPTTISPLATPTPKSSSSPVGAVAAKGSSINVAMIAGIISAVVVLLLLLLGIFLCRRKRRRQRAALLLEGPPPMEYSYAPRIDPLPVPTFLQSNPSIRSTSLSGYSGGRSWHSSNPSISGSSTTGTTNPFSYPASTRSGSRAPRRELDAGQLVEEEEPDEPTLPPEYGQVFGRRPASSATGLLSSTESSSAGIPSAATSEVSDLRDRDRKTRSRIPF